MRALPILLVAAALTACGGEPAADPSATEEVPMATTSAVPRTDVFGNEYAEVFLLTLPPGDSLPAHGGSARAVYSLSDYTLRYVAGADTTERAWMTGEAHVHAPGEHAIWNTGTTEARLLVVARTDAALPAGTLADAPAADGPVRLLVDDDAMRVTAVTLAPGASLPKHPGLSRIVYALSDYTLEYASNDAAAESKVFTAGTAHWHDADEHTLTNSGTTEARFLIVQFKR